jgi:hypothetical protein
MAFKPVKGYPKERWNREGCEAVCKWIGPWIQRRSFIIPTVYPYGSFALYRDTVSIEGQGRLLPDTGDEELAMYDEALIEATYTPISGTLLAQAKGLDNTWEFQISYNVEHFSLRNNLVWATDDEDTGKPVQKIYCHSEITLTKRVAATIPETAIATCRGRLNQGTFLGYTEATLLYMGAQSRGVLSPEGANQLSYSHKFLNRTEDWRKGYREEVGAWQLVKAKDSSPAAYVYELTSFAGLTP